jgi:hypothetical protein
MHQTASITKQSRPCSIQALYTSAKSIAQGCL